MQAHSHTNLYVQYLPVLSIESMFSRIEFTASLVESEFSATSRKCVSSLFANSSFKLLNISSYNDNINTL